MSYAPPRFGNRHKKSPPVGRDLEAGSLLDERGRDAWASPREAVEIVSLDHVSLSYANGHRVLRDVSYSFLAGSFHFLTGMSGAGKTSLLRLIYHAISPTQGNVTVFGRDVSDLSASELPAFRQKMGLVFQDCRLIDGLNVLDNVALALKIGGSELRRARQYAAELLEWVGLAAHLFDYPQTLSDGQKQRVAIARAVITRPVLLLADEPTGNVDDQTALKLLYLFEELNRVGTTVIMATHNHSLVAQLPYPELQVHQGRLLVSDPLLPRADNFVGLRHESGGNFSRKEGGAPERERRYAQHTF